MKPYGVPRVKDLESPDLVDIHTFGLKSSKSRSKEKCGDFKNSFRNPRAKAEARRIWKSKARIENKIICQKELLDNEN